MADARTQFFELNTQDATKTTVVTYDGANRGAVAHVFASQTTQTNPDKWKYWIVYGILKIECADTSPSTLVDNQQAHSTALGGMAGEVAFEKDGSDNLIFTVTGVASEDYHWSIKITDLELA